MDCRKYRLKKLIPDLLADYEFHSHLADAEHYRDFNLFFVTIKNGNNSPDEPDCELMIQTDQNDKIIHIEKLKKYWGAGYVIKSFPADIDYLAIQCINKLIK